jgi:hypothetical protein
MAKIDIQNGDAGVSMPALPPVRKPKGDALVSIAGLPPVRGAVNCTEDRALGVAYGEFAIEPAMNV